MASYFTSSVVFSRAEGECKYSLQVINIAIFHGKFNKCLFYTSYSPVVSQDAAILALINGS